MVTASKFKAVLTPPREKKAKAAGEMSETAKTYAREVMTEMLTGEPLETFTNSAMRWGTEQEPHAFDAAQGAIETATELMVSRPEGRDAFIEHPDVEGVGCSPDGTIGDDGLLELKCHRNPAIYLEDFQCGGMPKEHRAQVQGSLWVAKKLFYIFGSYHPSFIGSFIGPLYWHRVERDDAYIEKILAPAVFCFRRAIDLAYEKLEERFRANSGAPF